MGTAEEQWHQVNLPPEKAKYLRGTHYVWSRMADSKQIFVVLPVGEQPATGDGGYFSIVAALKVKGMDTNPRG